MQTRYCEFASRKYVLIDSLERVTSLSSHGYACSFHCTHSLRSPAYSRPPFVCSQTRYCEFASRKYVLIDSLERVTRIELALKAWEALVLPLNYTRIDYCCIYTYQNNNQHIFFSRQQLISHQELLTKNKKSFSLQLYNSIFLVFYNKQKLIMLHRISA